MFSDSKQILKSFYWHAVNKQELELQLSLMTDMRGKTEKTSGNDRASFSLGYLQTLHIPGKQVSTESKK